MKKLVSLLIALWMLGSLAVFASADEPVELTWWMFTATDAPLDQAMVQEELNKITADAIGVTINCVYIPTDQIALKMASGEYFDLTFTCGWYNDFAMNALDGRFYDIEGLVQELTPTLWESMPEMLWQGSYVKVDGEEKLFAVPVMKDYAIEVFWIIDIDYFVTEKGMEIPATMGFTDIEPYLEAFKEDYPDEYPFIWSISGPTSWSNFVDWLLEEAMIAVSYQAVGTEDASKVQLCFEMPEFIERVEQLHKWYEMGYVNPDAAITQSLARTAQGVIQSGQGFYGADSIWSNARQKASAISRFDGPALSTYSLRGSLTAINAASNHIEEALKLIEYVNTNKEYRNMMRYGIEGLHYEFNEDGTITKTQAGMDGYSPVAYTQGSYSLSAVEASPFPSVPADPNMWQVVWAGYEDAVSSAALGFSFDYTPVQTEVYACSAIKEMYWAELATGTSDPAEVFPQIIAELEVAGIRDIIDEAQRQLDAFLAE
ncbi:MAG: ABC transporter substrate-binding protein [Clostridia bacterium]|nr:ABC transporter substrate-binding protein [Clostridia bacterium]